MTGSIGGVRGWPARVSALIAALRGDHRIRVATDRARRSLTEAGAALAGSSTPAVAKDAAAAALCKGIHDFDVTTDDLRAALDASLDADRQDWARATPLMRWVIVFRGWLDRWIVRDRIKYHRHAADNLRRELGELAFDGIHEALSADVPPPIRDGITMARADIVAAQVARAQRLAPWNGRPLPMWLDTAVRETREILRHVWLVLKGRFFLSVPAIGALVASWCIAFYFTDSTIERIRRGIGFGGRHHLSAGSLSALKFWLPVLAAGLCAYAVSTIARRIHRKYAPPPDRVAGEK